MFADRIPTDLLLFGPFTCITTADIESRNLSFLQIFYISYSMLPQHYRE